MKHKTYEEFKKSVGGFPYTAPETKKNFLINSYSKLSLGMAKQQVYDILGEPDIEVTSYPKYSDKPLILGWVWMYYIYKSDSWGENIKYDKYIELFYDSNGKTEWIVPNNIEGLHELKGFKSGPVIFEGRFDSKTGDRIDN